MTPQTFILPLPFVLQVAPVLRLEQLEEAGYMVFQRHNGKRK
ncbi:hypothetical protein UUU_33790 [Klebsiella pneumoniae subsp. pneumoniae DSM 30104 = JCM 1662 = NBRC 14940]|nr:hypothetical protein UUU_33790 [Klebsiella pneumoniae subsp. pneumoniae DSM 30104 = JCM 1662 = NBRC 14940]